ncbi:MAG: hypothetical protein U1A25_02610 [Candidatus Sungbacteria bacterium]|nr:hypothetical protein [bacterium]MDZ4260533.1 hypothetical protein [Candidatus Sungbacteria bacterium]
MLERIKEGVIDVLFIPMSLFSLAGIHLFYLGWRLQGGVGRFLKNHNQNTLWEALGLEDPHIAELSQSGSYWMPEPQWFREVDYVKYANVGEQIDLFVEKSDAINAPNHLNERMVSVYATINWLFTVNPKKVRLGCHSKYTLAKALFVAQEFGGDTCCGGGIKNSFPPFFRVLFESIRFWRTVKTSSFSAYMRNSEYGNCVTYVDSKSGKISEVFLEIFLGKPEVIDRYLQNRKETSDPPLAVHVHIT